MKTHSKLKKGAVAAICAAAVLLSCLALLPGGATAVTSLPHIEELTESLAASQSSFVILEIVPQSYSGSIGYYIGGREPTADWPVRLSRLVGAEARSAEAAEIFSTLRTAGLMSDDTSTPLTFSGSYAECYPWQAHDSMTELSLLSPETVQANGVFTPTTEGGDYMALWVYNLNPGGGYVQSIHHFVSVVDTDGLDVPEVLADYYYTPVFIPLNDPESDETPELTPGMVIYTNTVEDDPLTEDFEPDTSGVYVFEGIVGEGLALDQEIQYYLVSADENGALVTGEPSNVRTASRGVYAAVSDSYSAALSGGGYFSRDLAGYEYVGEAQGDSSFQYDPDSDTANTITCSTIWYSGGYRNNSWFVRNVFDRDASAPIRFIVNSVTPQQVTSGMVDAADLIVLSAGQDLSGAGADLTTALVPDVTSPVFCDLPDSVALSIYNAATSVSLVPVIVDYRLTQTDSAKACNMGKLAQLLVDGAVSGSLTYTELPFAQLSAGSEAWTAPTDDFDADKSFVSKNLLCMNPGTALPALATAAFNGDISSTAPQGFAAVLEEIKYENFLREEQGVEAADRLAEQISLAGIIRYIINFAGQREVKAKTSVNVLEIQPGRGSYLTASMVYGWIGGEDSGVLQDNIHITTMSTSELVGKIEDLSEVYDMLYIGADTEGFNVDDNDETVYNDAARMNGLLYSNIGDTYNSTVLMAGLLDRDYYMNSQGRYPTFGSGYRYIDNSYDSDAGLFRFSGNDITSSKAQDVKDFAASGYPVIIEDKLLNVSYGELSYATVDASLRYTQNGSSVTISVSVSGLPEGTPCSYQWYSYTGNLYYAGLMYGETSSNLTVTADNTGRYYYCVVSATVNDTPLEAGSESLYVYLASSGVSIAFNNSTLREGEASYWRDRRYRYLSYSSYIASGTDYAGQYLYVQTTISAEYNQTPDDTVYSYQWYKNGSAIYGATDQYFYYDSAGSYYCVVTLEEVGFRRSGGGGGRIVWYECDSDDAVTRTAVITFSESQVYLSYSNASKYSPTLDITDYQHLTSSPLNGSYIDTASFFYEALNASKSAKNVMTVSEATADTDTVLNYLNLSKPNIVWTEGVDAYPVTYSQDNGVATSITPVTEAGETVHYLRYDFHIDNATDATPARTTYDCRLYIDLNSDGLYSSEEQITDCIVRTGAGALVQPVNGIYALRADQRYVLSRQMPTGYSGIIPWKLEVVKNGAAHIHSSQHAYTRIAPSGKGRTINVLQIASSTGYGVNLEEHQEATDGNSNSTLYSSVTNKTYGGIYGKLLADVTDFDVVIDTINTNQLDALGSNSDEIMEYLDDNYNMLIIGFDDMYDKLSQKAADAIVAFISTGKALLFTHDTTSLVNVPFSSYQMRDDNNAYYMGFDNPAYWGYDFNTVLRDAVKLDRYGIRSPLRSSLSDQTEGSNLSDTEISALLRSGYTVPFSPRSLRTGASTVAETQGFSNYALIRYGASTYNATTSRYSSGRETYYVSQVNEGQITSYPYDVNTADFGGTDEAVTDPGGNYMMVGLTHEQYYQINLNSDNIVVWYCLSNGPNGNPNTDYYSCLPNDIVNSYFIFSCGNVTYSGVGHSVSTTAGYYTGRSIDARYINEAKLFVNTMIAAYRTVSESPSVNFTSGEDGMESADYRFLTGELSAAGMTSGLLEQNLGDSESTAIYFKLSDPSLNKSKTIRISFFYADASVTQFPSGGDGLTPVTVTAYNSDTGAVCNLADMRGGLVYKLYLPAEVLEALAPDNVTALRLFVRVEALIDGTEYTDTDSIELRKLGLFTVG